MSMISLRSRLSFLKGLAPFAATRAGLSGSSRGPPGRATKVTARSLGKAMSTMVVQERHLWLNLAEMKDVNKARFLDACFLFLFCPTFSKKEQFPFLEAWFMLPSLSRWLTRTIRLGYEIQFTRRPPKFNGVLEKSVAFRNAPVLREGIAVLLAKDAI